MSKNWMSELTKDFGLCAADVKPFSTNVIKIPSPSWNWSVGNGGLVEGSSVLLYGPENGGKSLINQLIQIAIQNKYPDAICVQFDTEYSFNPEWFKKLGGDLNRLYLRKTNDPVKIFDYIEKDLVHKINEGCPIKSISIDSVKAIRFPKDIKEVSTKSIMGGSGAAYLSSVLKGVTSVVKDNNITTVYVQQVYEELDEYKRKRNAWCVPDGRSLKHAADVMILVERMQTKAGSIEVGETVAGTSMQIGHIIRTKCTKNRLNSPYRVAEFTLQYDKGIINQGMEIYNLGKSLGIIHHPINSETGKENIRSWVVGTHESIIGENNMIDLVKNDVKLQDEILEACNNVKPVDIDNMNKTVEAPEINFEG